MPRAIPIAPGQPEEAPAVHYVPTRCLSADSTALLRTHALPPVEELSEAQVLQSPIPRLRLYINVYHVRIAGVRSPKVRADYDRYFRLWFRHMYDQGLKAHRLAAYQPPARAPVRPALTPQSDPGYLRLRPLRPAPPQTPPPSQAPPPVAAGVAVREGGLRMDARVAALVRSYGLFGRAWQDAGDALVLATCDYLSGWGPGVERKEVACEKAAELAEALADVAAKPLVQFGANVEMDALWAVLTQTPLLGGGMCWRLARDDRSGSS